MKVNRPRLILRPSSSTSLPSFNLQGASHRWLCHRRCLYQLLQSRSAKRWHSTPGIFGGSWRVFTFIMLINVEGHGLSAAPASRQQIKFLGHKSHRYLVRYGRLWTRPSRCAAKMSDSCRSHSASLPTYAPLSTPYHRTDPNHRKRQLNGWQRLHRQGAAVTPARSPVRQRAS